MVNNLVKAEHQRNEFDGDLETLERATESDAELVSSDVESAADVDFLITMLPEGDHARAALRGEGDALAKLPGGAVVIASFPLELATARDIPEAEATAGAPVINAPGSGEQCDFRHLDLQGRRRG